ncbi:MAG: hypothetical protein GY704_07685, partial [Phycisphaeraceae bacterium]|nr:hypothetical protein [Phycisphaeraceae bacterium]
MSNQPQYPPHGAVGRSQETFNDVLYGQIRRTPWWLLSISIHAVLIVVMWSLSFSVGRVEEEISISMGEAGPPMDVI